MKHEAQRRLYLLFGIIVLLLSTLFWFAAIRFVSFPFLVLTWVLFVRSRGTDVRRPALIWVTWLMLSFSPIDIFPIPKGGPLRLVPLVMGLPTRETAERAKRREVILGGCIVSGWEPKYYLVW